MKIVGKGISNDLWCQYNIKNFSIMNRIMNETENNNRILWYSFIYKIFEI